jgi:hypothetical protein
VAVSRSPLGTLLIISAVDMLLCCFTMGVMLFLVFQPSLNSDRASAKLLGINGFEPIAAAGVGHLAAPTVIIIDNLAANQVVASNLPPGYTVPTTVSDPGGDGTRRVRPSGPDCRRISESLQAGSSL